VNNNNNNKMTKTAGIVIIVITVRMINAGFNVKLCCLKDNVTFQLPAVRGRDSNIQYTWAMRRH